ncbi:unnamed protein product [Mytilus edulis]|uniref:Uncharacterized protein n=1 Tax=Mytilus edulis TaxID=6550 RepID=A0A8S3VC12_MYTED|nr:unnamed protein product [Mytilus edulis]
MDKAENLSAQLSRLEKDLQDTLSRSRHSHSTPIPGFASDSGIITTQRNDKTYVDKTTPIHSTPVGPPHIGIGARPKVFKDIEVPNQLKLHDIQIVKENPVSLSDKKSPGKATGASMSKRRDIKVATYDGSGDWNDYRSHFEACSSINGWDNLEKGLYLAAHRERFAPQISQVVPGTVERKEAEGFETLPELGQTIRRLVNKAYPTAPGEVKETLAKEHFLDALINTEMRIKIKQSRPPDLNSAICLAVELETFYKAEKQFEVGKAHLRVVDNNEHVVRESESHDRLSDKIEGMLAAFNDQLANMRKELDEFKNKANMSGPVDRSKFLCYNCGKPGHMARNCNAPRNRRQNNQGSPGPSVRRTNHRSGKRKHKSLYLGSNTLNDEAGLYVELFINGIPAKFLIDTGATVSLVSDTLFEKLKSRDRPSVRQVTQEMIAANGESLKIIAVQVTGIIEPSEEFPDRGRLLEDPETNLKQVVIPMKERRKILEFAHDNKTAAHLGIKKTLARIKENFYWLGVRGDTWSYIAGCSICNKRKKPIPKRKAPMQVKESGYPMERIAMDILGELPASEKGNKYILVISDYYTKWTESHPMPNMEATTVANILMTEVISRFGVPTIIHSDQGSQFESHLFKEMCKLLQIEKTRTTPYHPKSDGMVERFNKTLATMLTGYVNEYHSNWDVLLPYVMMAYRSSQHETTGYTPNRLMLGREVSTPLDLIYKLPSQVKAIPQNQWAWELQEHMEEAHQIVQRHVSGQMLRQKKNHDKNVSWAKFEPGNMVYVYFPLRTPGLSPKFTNQWRGPYKVIKINSSVTYTVNCGRKGAGQVIHVDRMRPCPQQILRGEFVEEQSPEKTGELESEIHDEEVIIDSLPLLDLDDHEDVDNDRPRRFRKPPSWMKDYER